jgi:predicted ATPase
LVGRERELDLVRRAWERTVVESGCHLFTLLGLAGIGKSRLVAEMLSGVGDAVTVLRGRCLHYGEGITFWPLVEALAPVGDPAGRVLDRLGGGGAATPEELFWEVRRLLESLASERPVILHIDDLQWAEEMLLDLLDHVVGLSRGVPILLLCTARPELLDDRPNWGGGKLNATTALLEPLGESECEVLLDQLGDGINRELRARVIAASEGNPLFLEEMAVLAREQNILAIPSTIQALLAARLDRLSVEQREVLERGAVEGEVFHRAALRALADSGQAGRLDDTLAGLVRQELIRPYPATFEGDDAFRFRHILIRDTAYASLPKALRADLHERFANWLERRSPDLSEVDEIAGWHLEQAIRLRTELGRKLDPTLSRRAAVRLQAAGRRASWRGDPRAAVNLLERALTLAPNGSTLAATVCVDLAERLLDIGDLARIDELLSVAEQDPHTDDLAALARLEWMVAAQTQRAVRAIEARLPQILERFEKAGDAQGLARAHMAAFEVHWYAGRITAAGEELRLVADYAGSAGDGGTRSRALGWSLSALIAGPQDAKMLENAIAAIEREDLGPYLAAYLDRGRAELERLKGNLDEARKYAHRAIAGIGALGRGTTQGGFELVLGDLELLAGRPAAAIETLLHSDAVLAQLSEQSIRSTTQALLADAHERLGNRAAARAAIELSDELTASEDVLNCVTTHRVLARLALAEADDAAAEKWARSAVNCACRTEFVRSTADARLDLARVLSALARPQDAAPEARAALDLYTSKGDVLGARQASALLEGLGQATDQ